ncbi:MAG: outer membrane protein assembly factor BamD [Acidobacteriaceae bacterium]|nr:outer membrane protein assembly factor BamD [Acidobacteriaceae bacterium]
MLSGTYLPKKLLLAICSVGLLGSCIHRKYETPITKNTQQPDKVLFDQAMHDIEHGRYEVARISLQTLMNTYESSEYLAKAKLAIADSWFREGGGNGLAQAEAEYKDFQLFYPHMEESAEAQNRVCDIHYKQMDKSDRDISQTVRAEDECRNLLLQYPNSKFAPIAAQRLRNIQEVLAEHEFGVGNFYWKRDMNPAAANRLNGLVDQYPLYSKADEALYEAGDAYSKMGPRYRKTAGDMFARIVRDYPLGDRANDAKKRLEDMELPVPQADPTAIARMKFDEDNYRRPGLFARSTSFMRSSPDTSHAAKQGSPTMTDPKRTIPASIPVPNNTEIAGAGAGSGSGTTDVTATTASNTTALENKPDARSSGGTAQGSDAQANQPLPTNRDAELKKIRDKQLKKQRALEKKKKKGQGSDVNQQPQTQPANQTPTSTPVSTASAPNQLGAPNAANAATRTTATPQQPQ